MPVERAKEVNRRVLSEWFSKKLLAMSDDKRAVCPTCRGSGRVDVKSFRNYVLTGFGVIAMLLVVASVLAYGVAVHVR